MHMHNMREKTCGNGSKGCCKELELLMAKTVHVMLGTLLIFFEFTKVI